MRTIIVAYSNRSEEGLLAPVMRRLRGKFRVVVFDLRKFSVSLDVSKLGDIYNLAYATFEDIRPDFVMCPFDRKEQIFVALAAFHLNIPTVSMSSGDISAGTWDDITRHTLALYASIHFCDGVKASERTRKLLMLIGKDAEHIYDVGSTHFDDIEMDESLVPSEKYDLVLYNPPTKNPELISTELDEIEKMLDKTTLWIEPSGDPGSDEIIAHVKELTTKGNVRLHPNLSRSKFLGLMKKCSRYIGNSSSMFHEAPHFLKQEQIVHVGIRNRGREAVEIRPGGSDRIVQILEAIARGNSKMTAAFKKLGRNVTIHPLAKIVKPEVIEIGDNCQIDDFTFIYGGEGIRLGDYVHISSFSSVIGGGELEIGDCVGISCGCRVVTGTDTYKSGKRMSGALPLEERDVHRGRVVIGRDVNIGTDVVIHPDVRIGEGAVIGSCSLVLRDVEPWSVNVGTPCKKIVERPRLERCVGGEVLA